MATIDIFNNDAFSAISMSDAVEKYEYVPNFLGQLRVAGRPLFELEPIDTTTVAIEQLDNKLALVPTSPRGSAPTQKSTERRTMRNFNTVRLAQSDQIRADSIQNVRAFGSESELERMQTKVGRIQMKQRQDLEATWEHMRLGAVQGIVYDSDGSSVIYDYYSEFGVTQPAEVNFALGTATTDVRGKCTQIKRDTIRELGSLATPSMEVYGLASDSFWDSLIKHANVRETYLNWEAASSLREDAAFAAFRFGGINFVNYRGTDDNSKVAVPDGKCKFFPAGAPGMFKMALSPAETFEFANTEGREVYSMIVPDTKRNMYVDVETYSYPLPIATRPLALQRAGA